MILAKGMLDAVLAAHILSLGLLANGLYGKVFTAVCMYAAPITLCL